jgi:competence ComEA-like helix-hairpin-helix protein
MPRDVRRVSSPIAACGVILVAIALGALAARHRAERPSEAPVVLVAPSAEPAGPLDLNRADARALEALPRIGPSLAQRIVEDRDARGPFHHVDELDRVRGIGPATVDAIRALVTVGSAADAQP